MFTYCSCLFVKFLKCVHWIFIFCSCFLEKFPLSTYKRKTVLMKDHSLKWTALALKLGILIFLKSRRGTFKLASSSTKERGTDFLILIKLTLNDKKRVLFTISYLGCKKTCVKERKPLPFSFEWSRKLSLKGCSLIQLQVVKTAKKNQRLFGKFWTI